MQLWIVLLLSLYWLIYSNFSDKLTIKNVSSNEVQCPIFRWGHWSPRLSFKFSSTSSWIDWQLVNRDHVMSSTLLSFSFQPPPFDIIMRKLAFPGTSIRIFCNLRFQYYNLRIQYLSSLKLPSCFSLYI